MNTAFIVILLILFADHSGDGELFLENLRRNLKYVGYAKIFSPKRRTVPESTVLLFLFPYLESSMESL